VILLGHVVISNLSGLGNRCRNITSLLLRPRSRRQEIGDEYEQEQAVDDDADNRRCEDAALAVCAHPEQSNDSEHKPHHDEQQGDKLDDNSRARLSAKHHQKENNDGANPTELGSLM
jgi:hypothetical protein